MAIAPHQPRCCLVRLIASLTMAASLAWFPMQASGANIAKLRSECDQNNTQACEELKRIALNTRENSSSRAEAIDSLHDMDTLTQIVASADAIPIIRAANRRLQVVLDSNFVEAAGSGDVDALKGLAAKGATVDSHGVAREVESVIPIPGGFQFRMVCREGALASQAMLAAVRSGKRDSVQVLIDLGTRVTGEYVVRQAQVTTGFVSQDYAWSAACNGMSMSVNPGFVLGSDGSARSTAEPVPEKSETYAAYARDFAHQDIAELLQSHMGQQAAEPASGEATPPSARTSTLPATVLQPNLAVEDPATRSVQLHVKVWDSRGDQVSDLKPADFKVLDNSREQVLSSFKIVTEGGEGVGYEISIVAARATKPGDFHAVDVRVLKPHLTVKAEVGYQAQP